MRTKELKVYNLPNNRTINADIDAKPYTLLLGLMGLGVMLMIFNAYIYGASLLLLGLFAIALLPRKILIEFSDNYMVLYNKVDKNDCVIIYYDDIVFWNYQRNVQNDTLTIELLDGSVESINCFDKHRIQRFMFIYAKGKKKVTR